MAARHWSSLPLEARKPGDSGEKAKPVARKRPKANWIATGTRHEAVPVFWCMPLLTQLARKMPSVTQPWNEPVTTPRHLGGAASAWKTGTRPESVPTP
jgi:hypothetical protein